MDARAKREFEQIRRRGEKLEADRRRVQDESQKLISELKAWAKRNKAQLEERRAQGRGRPDDPWMGCPQVEKVGDRWCKLVAAISDPDGRNVTCIYLCTRDPL